jgi:hypothetical protein
VLEGGSASRHDADGQQEGTEIVDRSVPQRADDGHGRQQGPDGTDHERDEARALSE